jgi:hypothetical protein
MIEDINWKSLEDRRKIAKLTMMYKLVNGLVLVNRSQTELAYSTVGLTSDLYAVSFILLLFMFKYRFKNSIVLLALLQMFLM